MAFPTEALAYVYTRCATCRRRPFTVLLARHSIVLLPSLFFGFFGPYEMQGPLMGWWMWPLDDRVTKAGCTMWQFGPLADRPNDMMVRQCWSCR